MKNRIQLSGLSWAALKALPINKQVTIGYATTALWDGVIAGIYHHGNQIAALTKETIALTHCGFDSNVTRDRLDQIVTANYGYGLYRVCKSDGRISLTVNGGSPIAFDTITLKRNAK
jgi:hypothetical protein